jgi:hypothetical protein
VKQPLREYEFADRDTLLHAIEDIVKDNEKLILEDVFFSWMERLRQDGSAAGEDVESTKLLCDYNFSALISCLDAYGFIGHGVIIQGVSYVFIIR